MKIRDDAALRLTDNQWSCARQSCFALVLGALEPVNIRDIQPYRTKGRVEGLYAGETVQALTVPKRVCMYMWAYAVSRIQCCTTQATCSLARQANNPGGVKKMLNLFQPWQVRQ
jgi:hypothetical protein